MTFKPGQSGNLRGRPKKDFELAKLCQEFTVEGVQRLMFLARGGAEGEPTVPYPVQLGALKELLDRGFGKAPQQLHHSGELNQSLAEELDGLVRRAKAHRHREESEGRRLASLTTRILPAA